MDREHAIAAALQLQRDAGLMTSNLQVLGQFATSLNRMSFEVLRLAIDPEIFPSIPYRGLRVARVILGLCRPHLVKAV